jgi:hypothetical protein
MVRFAMKVDLSYGITSQEYAKIEPTLERPLSLGGIRRRPRTDADLQGLQIRDIQKKPSSGAASTARSRAKRSS